MSRSRFLPAAGFHFLTPVYDWICVLFGFGGAFRERLVRDLEPARGDRVLDIGCGTGVLAARIARAVPDGAVVGVDPDVRALRIARRRGRARDSRVTLCASMGQRLPFPSASFDRVVSSLALHHVPDEAKLQVLEEARRVLRPEGTFLLADFDTTRSHLPLGRRRSRQPLARWLADAGWDAVPVGTLRRAHIWRARPRARDEQPHASPTRG